METADNRHQSEEPNQTKLVKRQCRLFRVLQAFQWVFQPLLLVHQHNFLVPDSISQGSKQPAARNKSSSCFCAALGLRNPRIRAVWLFGHRQLLRVDFVVEFKKRLKSCFAWAFSRSLIWIQSLIWGRWNVSYLALECHGSCSSGSVGGVSDFDAVITVIVSMSALARASQPPQRMAREPWRWDNSAFRANASKIEQKVATVKNLTSCQFEFIGRFWRNLKFRPLETWIWHEIYWPPKLNGGRQNVVSLASLTPKFYLLYN